MRDGGRGGVRVGNRDRERGRIGDVAGRIAGTSQQRVAGVRRRGRVPAHAVGSGGVLGAEQAPSSRNCTPATPTLSDALAETVTVPVTACGGRSRQRDGGRCGVRRRLLETVTVSGAELVMLPAASRARASSVWLPFVAVVVFQLTL